MALWQCTSSRADKVHVKKRSFARRAKAAKHSTQGEDVGTLLLWGPGWDKFSDCLLQ